jgi:hypothetical protein
MVAWAGGDEITVAAATAAVSNDGIRIRTLPTRSVWRITSVP